MKELNQIKKSGFKTPENYFNDLEDHLLSNIKLSEKIEASGFKIPENYLETIEDNILKKTHNTSSKVIVFKRNYLYAISSIAAAVLLLISLNLSKSSTTTIDLVDNEAIENYILEEFETDELASLFDDNELLETDFINFELTNTLIESTIENGDDLELYNSIDLNNF